MSHGNGDSPSVAVLRDYGPPDQRDDPFAVIFGQQRGQARHGAAGSRSRQQLGEGLVLGAHALSLFRVLPDGEGRAYTTKTFPDAPWAGCQQAIRAALDLGWVTSWEQTPPDSAFGVLDVLDLDGDIVQDFAVPTCKNFVQLKHELNIRRADL